MKSQIENRIDKLRLLLKEKDMDAVLVTKRENYVYLSGFNGSSAHLIITQNDAFLVTDFRYVEQAVKQAPLYEIIEYKDSILVTINNVIKTKGIDILGFEEDHVTCKSYREFEEKLNVKEIKPLAGMIDNLRMKKDKGELELIKKAVKIADDAFSHILGYIKPGVKEIEVAAELEYFIKKQGARGVSFDTIVASGYRSALPHGVASEKAIEQGDAVTMDFGAIYEDYCSDMTRTVFVGKPDEELSKIYNIVLSAQQSAVRGAKKGLTGKEIDSIARDLISKEGYGDCFGHGLGHGVGLEIHEEPRLSLKGSIIMDDGMVVTVEPGIYIPGLGGVRIEDMIVINGDNPLVLTGSSREMIVI